MVTTGLEPAKRTADDLELPSFDHLDTLPLLLSSIETNKKFVFLILLLEENCVICLTL